MQAIAAESAKTLVSELKLSRLKVNSEGSRDSYLLQWRPVDKAAYFEIQASLNPLFEEYQSFYTDKDYHHFELLKDKKYFLRLIPFGFNDRPLSGKKFVIESHRISPRGNQSFLSTEKLKEIFVELPEVRFFPESTMVNKPIKGNKVWQVIRWQGLEGFLSSKHNIFEMQISTNKEFKKWKNFYSTTGSLHTMLDIDKIYYFRYRLKNYKSKTTSHFSEVKERRLICCGDSITASAVAALPEGDRNLTSIEQNQLEITEDIDSSEFQFFGRYWFYGGMGADFSHQTQKVDNFIDMNYQSFLGPSYSLGGGLFFNKVIGLRAEQKMILGKVDNSSNNQNLPGYTLNNQTLELLWSPSLLQKEKSQWVFRAGAQHRQVPLLTVEDFINNSVEVITPSLLNLSLGASYSYRLSSRWGAEAILRAQ